MPRDIESKARRRVAAKKSFFYHLGVYCIMGVFFFLMNVLTDPLDLWFFFPMLPWGVGLGIHYITVFGLPGMNMERWEERQMEREIDRLRRNEQNEPIVNARPDLDLDERLDLKELKRKVPQTDKNYRDDELV
ncbi:MAG: 2TM domain-containing protein [Phaeodactylibacter sp.]|nr:2TM domain-containing protein [Phaeodactylibacter sp.]